MQLSTKARYAARAMVELAMSYNKGALQLREIARKQDISEKYLEQIMISLRAGRFVYAQKGSRGGYHLTRHPNEITLFDIVHSVEGSLAPVFCVDNPESCSRVSVCVTRNVWLKLKNVLVMELKSITLDDLAREQRQMNEKQASSLYYQI